MSQVIDYGTGKKRYELKQAWWELLILASVIGFVYFLVLVTAGFTKYDLLWLVVASLVFAAFARLIWPIYNYVIVHPDRVDTSRYILASKARKREKHRIDYGDIISVTADDRAGRLLIVFELRGLKRTLGFNRWSVKIVLRHPHQASELKNAIDLGVKRARERIAPGLR